MATTRKSKSSGSLSRRAGHAPGKAVSADSRHRKLLFEQLEPRYLLHAVSPGDDGVDPHHEHEDVTTLIFWSAVDESGAGKVLDSQDEHQLALGPKGVTPTGSGGEAKASPVANLPVLHSNPGAPAALFLDFDGHFEAQWGSYRNVTTPVFDFDGNTSSFSTSEVAVITEVWRRVAEDFAPFHIDVTTEQPASFANGVGLRVSIGGNGSWIGPYGGVAYVNSFTNSIPNVVYVFSSNLSNNARYIAEASSHESGHAFGLQHQSVYNSSGQKIDEYNRGNSQWAPIMGVGYNAARTTWHNGPSSLGPTAYQDDMAIIARTANRFGYRADDHGNTTATATPLSFSNGQFSSSGIVANLSDSDYFSFNTAGGRVSLNVNVASVGPNLDAQLSLYNSLAQLIASVNPTTSFAASLTTTLAAGTYYAAVSGGNVYGSAGQYTFTGSVTTTSAPEIEVFDGTTSLTDGVSVVDFGTRSVRSPLTKTFTVRNVGNATLNLGSTISVPSGFRLMAGFGTRLLAPGQSTTFRVRYNASTVGTQSGQISFGNNDSDENPFNFTVRGTAVSGGLIAGSPSRGGSGVSKAGASFGAGLEAFVDHDGSQVDLGSFAFDHRHIRDAVAAALEAFEQAADAWRDHHSGDQFAMHLKMALHDVARSVRDLVSDLHDHFHRAWDHLGDDELSGAWRAELASATNHLDSDALSLAAGSVASASRASSQDDKDDWRSLFLSDKNHRPAACDASDADPQAATQDKLHPTA